MYSSHFGSIGNNVIIGRSVNIANVNNIQIGSNVDINAEVYLVASNSKIIIGDSTMIAPRCILQTQNHIYNNKSVTIKEQGSISKDIIVGKDVWIAANCIILPGVNIADGCVIGAGSIVTKNTDPYCVYAGVPARKIGERK